MAWPKNKSNPDITWKIWYYDPTNPTFYRTFSNLNGAPVDAPTHGVVLIVQTADGGRSKDMCYGTDFYIIDEEGKWVGVNKDGLEDRDLRHVQYKAKKWGLAVNTDRYIAIKSAAHNDPDFGGLDRAILVDELEELVDRRPIRREKKE